MNADIAVVANALADDATTTTIVNCAGNWHLREEWNEKYDEYLTVIAP